MQIIENFLVFREPEVSSPYSGNFAIRLCYEQFSPV